MSSAGVVPKITFSEFTCQIRDSDICVFTLGFLKFYKAVCILGYLN